MAAGRGGVNRGNGVALWRQIQKTLEEDIARGAFRPGDRLPTESELAARFAVNRHTLRRAMAGLQEAGLIRIEQGRGSFVQEHMVPYTVAKRTRFQDTIARLNRLPGSELLRALVLPAEPEVARGLGLRPGRPVILIERIGRVDGRPINVVAHHFSEARVPGMIEAYGRSGSITRALAEHGIEDYIRKVTRVVAAMPGEDDARHLQQPRNQPILLTESINVDLDGRPVEYSVARLAGQRVQLVFEP